VHALLSGDATVVEIAKRLSLIDDQRSNLGPVLTVTLKPEQYRVVYNSTSISSRQCSAFSGRPLPERTHFGPQSVAKSLNLL